MTTPTAKAVLRISSKNYSSWSLRGWLLTRMSGLPFEEEKVSPDDPAMRAELLLQSSSILIPCLFHDGSVIWDTIAIAEYLNELCPAAQMLPANRQARAHARSIAGEMHAGFNALRSSLPMNLRGHFSNFKVWSAARADIERIMQIWHDCLKEYGGPWLFGAHATIADAMYAPVVTRFHTYDVKLDPVSERYCHTIQTWPDMMVWRSAALQEPEEQIPELELDAEF